MTFTPSVQSKVDVNNTTNLNLGAGATFTGSGTLTTGYDTAIVTVQVDTPSAATGLEIQFSDDNVTFATLFSDTVFATGTNFTRTYLLIKKYYRVRYTTVSATGNFTLTTRITPQLDSSALTQATSIAVFDTSVESTLDAFGKLRVSMPQTLLEIRFPANNSESTQVRQNVQQVTYATSGAGYSYAATGTGYLELSATNAGVGFTVSQSRTYVTYQAGKSLLIMMSGVFKPTNPKFTSRVGYFESSYGGVTPTPFNGIYLSFDAGVPTLNIADNGSVQSFPQSSWNVDKMNGTGVSGLNLNFLFTQLFVVDVEWLGVGRVRFGFYAYGRIQYCHQIPHLNVLTTPYARSINLPLTYMLLSSDAALGTTNIRQICATVLSEGGYNPVGRLFSANTGAINQIQVSATETPLLALRGGATGYNHQTIVPVLFTLIDTENNNTLLYQLWVYLAGATGVTAPTVTSWINASPPYSLAQYAPGGNITALGSGGILINSGYLLGKGSNTFTDLSTAFSTLLVNLAADITNTADVLLLTATKVNAGAGTAKVWASMDWQELY